MSILEGMSDSVLFCLSVLDNLRKIYEQLKENHATCIRLGQRAEVFRQLLEELRDPTLKTGLIERSLGQLKETLQTVFEFVKKFTKEGFFNKIVKTVYRFEHAIRLRVRGLVRTPYDS